MSDATLLNSNEFELWLTKLLSSWKKEDLIDYIINGSKSDFLDAFKEANNFF